MDARFTDEMNPAQAARVMDVLRAPRLWIPTEQDYGDTTHKAWLAKVEQELVDGNRYALHAQMGTQSIGAVIWRPRASEPNVLDIRNISIHPDVKGRYFGAFMLRNVEWLMLENYPDATRIEVDTKTTNADMLSFLARQGYEVTGINDLYDSGRPDVLLRKTIK